ncbi:MAG: 4Fe-4S dicluster domain-containing protein [Chloroflexota bacterium]
MMIITYNKLNDWLTALCNNHQMFGPTNTDSVVTYTPLSRPSDLVLNAKPTKSPKSIIFPQTETLFTYSIDRSVEISEPELDGSQAVIFNIRPCDARGFLILDLVFNDEYVDPYYVKARERFTLVGFSCTTPWQNCFCTSVNGSPGSTDGLDILLTDLGDRYLVEILSPKGKTLIDETLDLFSQATEEDWTAKKEVIELATTKIKRYIDITDIPQILGDMFDHEYWMQVSKKCLGCGICTYLCPTCHCFDMQDEIKRTEGRRARMWDSCMFCEYTKHTSGHNPRPARINRLRNRVFHKFKYYPDNFGEMLCVGCGRCIDSCPANVDIAEIIAGVREVSA